LSKDQREQKGKGLLRRGLARHLLLVCLEELGGSGLGIRVTLGFSGARRKLLKIRRLEVLEFLRHVPFFRQASKGRKRESVWVI
jgi:hypothetical protein